MTTLTVPAEGPLQTAVTLPLPGVGILVPVLAVQVWTSYEEREDIVGEFVQYYDEGPGVHEWATEQVFDLRTSVSLVGVYGDLHNYAPLAGGRLVGSLGGF